MHETSELYKSLWANPLRRVETKIDVAGAEYLKAEYPNAGFFYCRIYGGALENPGFGSCASRTLELRILPSETIPRSAKIQVFCRLTAGDQISEWIKKGEFFVSRRERDKRTGIVTIKAFDAMLRANDVWLNESYSAVNWPMSQEDAVNDIANRMGVEVDSRTVLPTEFPVDYPVDENGDLTMWNVLCYIAVSNAGNWIITDDGKLRLLVFGALPKETNYLVTEYGAAITFGEVRILV